MQNGGFQGLGEKEWRVPVKWGHISVREDEKVLEKDGCDGCTTMWMMPLNRIPKNGYNGTFYVIHILPQ